VRNFPEVAQFYVDEVISPSNQMLAGVIERGIERGEFRRMPNVPQVVHAIVAPMVLLAMNKHSLGACSAGFLLDPKGVTEALIDLALHGLVTRPAAPAAQRKNGSR
jgi:hypothetical protein